MSASSEIIGTPAARGIFSGANDLDDVAIGRDERVAIQEQIHLDDLDRFVALDRFGDEDVDLALHEIVHDQLLARELFRRGAGRRPRRCSGIAG